jgi:hypothetical protein
MPCTNPLTSTTCIASMNPSNLVLWRYYKKPGDFTPAGVLSCGVASTVQVFEPPHLERSWPHEKVLRVKLETDADEPKRGGTFRDDFALMSTSTLELRQPTNVDQVCKSCRRAMHTSTHTHTHTHAPHARARALTLTHARKQARTLTLTHTHTHARAQARTHTHASTHARAHTHTHTPHTLPGTRHTERHCLLGR